jgi:hypothetical protein
VLLPAAANPAHLRKRDSSGLQARQHEVERGEPQERVGAFDGGVCVRQKPFRRVKFGQVFAEVDSRRSSDFANGNVDDDGLQALCAGVQTKEK